MKLINEIIAEAVDSEKSVSGLLRKCLVLAFDLKNDKLKAWVESELNGYDDRLSVPDYRSASLDSKGNFVGPYGGSQWVRSNRNIAIFSILLIFPKGSRPTISTSRTKKAG